MAQKKGYKQSPEHIKKRFENRKNPWLIHEHPKGMQGKHHSEKTKIHLSKKLEGREFSEDHKIKIGKGVKNWANSEEGQRIKSDNTKLEKNPMWNGGRKISQGYIKILFNGRYVFEHHLIWCLKNGVNHLPEGCLIHHINGDRSDNRIENLQLMSIGFHTQLHSAARKCTCEV
jgi:hypothetical protein